MNLWERFVYILETTPVDVLSAYALLFVFPVAISGVLVWGFLQMWIYHKQNQYFDKLNWKVLAISVPKDSIQTPKGMENFFNNLAGAKSSIKWKEKWLDGKFQAFYSLELVSEGGQIQFYIRCTDKYIDIVEAAFYAQYPEAQILEVEDYVKRMPPEFPDEDYDLWGSEMTLTAPTYFPIKTYADFEHMGEADLRFKDPILPFIEAMGKMRPGENYMIQIIIMPPDEQDWRKEGEKFIKTTYGKTDPKKPSMLQETVGWIPSEMSNQILGQFEGGEAKTDDWAMFKITPQDKDKLDAVNRKISKLGWLVKVRFVYIAKRDVFRKGTIAAMSKGLFHQFGHLTLNKFGLHGASTPMDDYLWEAWAMPGRQKRLWSRYRNRSLGAGASPSIMNSEELATMFHFPPADARTPVMTSLGARLAEAPTELSFAADGAVLLQLKQEVKLPTAPPSGKLAVPHPQAPTLDKSFDRQTQAVPSTPFNAYVNQGVPAPLPPGVSQPQKAVNQLEAPPNLPL